VTSLVKTTTGALTPKQAEDRWKVAASKARQYEPERAGTWSIRGGVFRHGEDEYGSELCVIIVEALRENTYYPKRFTQGEKNVPVCYAYGHAEGDMAPHESMASSPYFQPQAEACSGCPKNVWGSADKGEGKACQNRRRLAMLPAGVFGEDESGRVLDLFDTPEHYERADMTQIRLPVTSVKFWKEYLKHLDTKVGRPPWGVITRVFLKPDANDQFHVQFELIDVVPDELYDVLEARAQQAAPQMVQVYQAPED
jgi:hypothetical protein